jgi:AmmeMemoRadiSam system protein A/AmmeMemoRadiSam system protein B
MSLLRAYLLPHPPLALPGIGRGQERQITKTLDALDEAAAEIAALAPETIIFITPHAMAYGDYFHISPGESAEGDFARFGAGEIKLAVAYDREMANEIARVAEANDIPAGQAQRGGSRDASLDHGAMVPLWYIQKRHADFKAVRISPSSLDPQAHYRMGRCLAAAAKGLKRKTVLVASGDLSHRLADGGPYGYAPEGPAFDRIVCDAFTSGDLQTLFDKAHPLRDKAAECGLSPCMMLAGCFDGMEIETRLFSYEGPFGVGYAVASAQAGKASRVPVACPYRDLARHALESRVLGIKPCLPPDLPPELTNRQAGAFVSLHIAHKSQGDPPLSGQLRGCIGTILPTCDNLALEIMQNAVSAGLRDNRFNPVTPEELPYLTYKVDVLAAPEPVSGPEALDVKRYGVIVTQGYRRGLLLPNLDGIDSVAMQIAIAKQKAGISETAPVALERFEVVRYG